MGKGARTRQHILAQAAPVFNTYGYSGTSMAELTRATGLEKGGIYNHFASKEALGLAAFDYAVDLIGERIAAVVAEHAGAIDRLRAVVDFFAGYVDSPPIAGGCPILNTAVEADDTQPALRARAQVAMTDLQKLIGTTVKQGVARGELRPEADPRAVATFLTAALEGAIMLGRLYHDPAPMRTVVAQLTAYIQTLATGEILS
jgi:AcrR family transcriptional regulator